MKNYNILISILLIFLFFSQGCEIKTAKEENLYQIMTAEDGSLYRLNRKTGHIVLIRGDKIVPLEVARQPKPQDGTDIVPAPTQVKELPKTNPKTQTIVKALNKNMKEWPEQQLSGKNLKVSLQTNWENNKLRYVLEAYPYLSLKKMLDKKEDDIYYQHKWHGFVVKLIDANEDVIKIIPVKLWDMARTLDKKGRFISVKREADIELLEDEFIRVSDYTIDWKLDRILIPDYKFKDKVDDLIQTYNWYGEVDPKKDIYAPDGAKYWWMTFPDKKKIYFSNEEELLDSYQKTIEKIIKKHSK